MDSSPPVLALCWSLPEEPDIVRFLEGRHGSCRVLPLRYRAMEAARRFVPADKLLDPGQVVPAAEGALIWEQGIEWQNRLIAALRARRSRAWIAGLDLDDLGYILGYVLYWKLFFQRLRDRFPGSPVSLYGPFSGGAKGFDAMHWSMRLSELVYRVTFHGGGRGGLAGRLRRGMLAFGGHAVNRWPRLFSRRQDAGWPAIRKTKTVVFGMPPGDWMAQRGLMAGLVERGADDIRWLAAEHPHYAFQPDELKDSALRDRIARQTDTLPVNPHRPLALLGWRRPWFDALSIQGVRDALRRVFRELPGVALDEVWADAVAEFISGCPPFFRLQYEGVADLLGRYDPETVVTQSCVELANMAGLWAALHGRRHVRLLHGAEVNHNASSFWYASEVGVMGADLEEKLRASRATTARLHRVGGVHMADAFARQGKLRGGDEAPASRRVCYLLGRLAIMGLRGYGWQAMDDLCVLGRQLAGAGWRLALRPHRGISDQDAHDVVRGLIAQGALSAELSDPLGSLREDLAASGAALISQWGGAGVAALYAGLPLVGWRPRPFHVPSDEIVRELPLFAEDAGDIPALLARLESDPAWRREQLARQDALLARMIEDPYGDSWRRSIDLILNTNRNERQVDP